MLITYKVKPYLVAAKRRDKVEPYLVAAKRRASCHSRTPNPRARLYYSMSFLSSFLLVFSFFLSISVFFLPFLFFKSKRSCYRIPSLYASIITIYMSQCRYWSIRIYLDFRNPNRNQLSKTECPKSIRVKRKP